MVVLNMTLSIFAPFLYPIQSASKTAPATPKDRKTFVNCKTPLLLEVEIKKK
jgi:hypothetical protein